MVIDKTFSSIGELPEWVVGHAKQCGLVIISHNVNNTALEGSLRYRVPVSVLHTAFLFCCTLLKPSLHRTTHKVVMRIYPTEECTLSL